MKHDAVNQGNEKGEIDSQIRQTLLRKRIFWVSDPKMTLEWPQNDPRRTFNELFDPKCVLVLCGMIFLTSGPNMKTIGPPEQQILQVI